MTPNTLWPADGQFVRVTATLAVRDDHDRRPESGPSAITRADLILKERVLLSAEGREPLPVMSLDEIKRHPVLFATPP